MSFLISDCLQCNMLTFCFYSLSFYMCFCQFQLHEFVKVLLIRQGDVSYIPFQLGHKCLFEFFFPLLPSLIVSVLQLISFFNFHLQRKSLNNWAVTESTAIKTKEQRVKENNKSQESFIFAKQIDHIVRKLMIYTAAQNLCNSSNESTEWNTLIRGAAEE